MSVWYLITVSSFASARIASLCPMGMSLCARTLISRSWSMIQPVSSWLAFTPSTTTTPTESPSSCTTKWIIGIPLRLAAHQVAGLRIDRLGAILDVDDARRVGFRRAGGLLPVGPEGVVLDGAGRHDANDHGRRQRRSRRDAAAGSGRARAGIRGDSDCAPRRGERGKDDDAERCAHGVQASTRGCAWLESESYVRAGKSR